MASNLELKIKLLVDGLSDLLKLKTEVTGLGSSAEDMATAATDAAKAMQDLGTATTDAATAVQGAASKTSQVGTNMGDMATATADAATAISDLNTVAADMGSGLGDGAKAALAAATELQGTATAAQSAATKIDLAATTMEGLAAGLNDAALEAEAAATNLGGMDAAANDAATAARSTANACNTSAIALRASATAAQESASGYQKLADAAITTAKELVSLSNAAPNMRDTANAAKDTAAELTGLATEARTTASNMAYAATQAEALATALGGDDQAANDTAAAFKQTAKEADAAASVLETAAASASDTATALSDAATAAEDAASGMAGLSKSEIAAKLQEQADAASDAASALNDVAVEAEALAGADREQANAARDSADALQEEATQAMEAAIQLKDVADAASAAAAASGDLGDTESANRMQDIANAALEAASGLQDIATSAEDVATALDIVAGSSEEAAVKAGDIATQSADAALGMADQAAAANDLALGLGSAAGSATDAATSIGDVGGAAGEAAIGLTDAGGAANDAAAGIEGVGDAASDAAPTTADLSAQMQALAKALLNSQGQVGTSSGMFSTLKEKIKELKEASPGAAASIDLLGASIGPLVGILATVAGIKISFDFLKDAAVKASETELLGITMRVVGENTGYTAGELGKFEVALKAQGISTSAARQSMTQMMQAGLDLGNAADGSSSQIAKLARTAQDLAVVTGENSSETLKRMVTNIQQMDTMGLRFMGVTVSMEAAWAKYQNELGQAGPLTEAQKRQAVLNAVLAEGEKMAGAYELSMKNVAKQVASMSRYTEEFSTSIGNTMLPAYGAVVDAGTAFMKNLMKVGEEFDKGKNNGKEYGAGIKAALDPLVPIFTNIVSGALKLVADLGPAFRALGEAIGSAFTVLGEIGEVIMGANGGFDALELIIKGVTIAFRTMGLGVQGLGVIVQELMLGYLALQIKFLDWRIAVEDSIPGLGAHVEAMKKQRDAAVDSSDKIQKSVDKQVAAMTESARSLQDYADGTEAAAEAGKKLNPTAADNLKAAIIALTREQNTGKESATGLASNSQIVAGKMEDLAAKVEAAGKSGAITDTEMKALNKSLGNIDTKIGDDLNEAFKQLKVSAKELGSGVSAGADEVAGALSKMVANGKATADQFQKVFAEKISMAKNAEELAAFTASLDEAKDRWPGAAKELNAELAQVGKQFDLVYQKQLDALKTKADWDTLKTSIVALGKDGALSQGELTIAIEKGEQAVRKLDPAFIAAAKASKEVETASKDVDKQMQILEGTISKVAGQAEAAYTAMASGYGKLSGLVESGTKTQMDAIDRRFAKENTLLDTSLGNEQSINTKKTDLLVSYIAEKNALIEKSFAAQDGLLTKQVAAEGKALSAKMSGYKEDEIRINESLGKQADKHKEYQAALKDLDDKRKGAVADHEIKVMEVKASSLEKQASAYQSNIDKLIGEESRLLGKIKGFATEAEQIKMSAAEKIRNSEINLLDGVEKYEAQKTEITRMQSDARQALAEGNMEKYKALISSIQGKESELNKEVKDGEKIIISKEQAQKNYADSVKATEAIQLAANAKEKAAAEAALAQTQAQIKATEQMRDAVLEMVAALKKMMGEKVELKITADAKQAEDKAQALLDLLAKKDVIMPIKVQLEAAQVALKKMEDDMAAGKPFKVDPDVTKAEAALKALRDQPGVDLKVKADAESALAAIEKTKIAIEAAGGKPIQVTATVDKVMDDLKGISDAFDKLKGEAKVTLAADMTAVRTDLGKLKEDIAKGDKLAIQADVTKAESSIAKMRADAGANITPELKLALDKATADLAKLKTEAATPIQIELKANMTALEKDIKGIEGAVNASKPSVTIIGDLADVQAKMGKLKADLESPTKMPIAADIEAAKTSLEKLRADAIKDNNTKLVLEVDKALADLEKVKGGATKIGETNPKVVVNVDDSQVKKVAGEIAALGDTPPKNIAIGVDGSQVISVRTEVEKLYDSTGKPLRSVLEINSDQAAKARGDIVKVTDALGKITFTQIGMDTKQLDQANSKVELLHTNGRKELLAKVTVNTETVDSAQKKLDSLGTAAAKGVSGKVDYDSSALDKAKSSHDAVKGAIEGNPAKAKVTADTSEVDKADSAWGVTAGKIEARKATASVKTEGTQETAADIDKILGNLEAIGKARTVAEITSNAKSSHSDLEYARKLLSDINGVKSQADFTLNSNAKEKKTEIDAAMKPADKAVSTHDVESNAKDKKPEIDDAMKSLGDVTDNHNVGTDAEAAKSKVDDAMASNGDVTDNHNVSTDADTTAPLIDTAMRSLGDITDTHNVATDAEEAKGAIDAAMTSGGEVGSAHNITTNAGEVDQKVDQALAATDVTSNHNLETNASEVKSGQIDPALKEESASSTHTVNAETDTAKGKLDEIANTPDSESTANVYAETGTAEGQIMGLGDLNPIATAGVDASEDLANAEGDISALGDLTPEAIVGIDTTEIASADSEISDTLDGKETYGTHTIETDASAVDTEIDTTLSDTEGVHAIEPRADAVFEAINDISASTSSTHEIFVTKTNMFGLGGLTGGIMAFADGGEVPSHATAGLTNAPHMTGGTVPGAGNHDSIHRTLDQGAFVIRKSAVQMHGAGNILGLMERAKSMPKLETSPVRGRARSILMPGEIVVPKDTVSRLGGSMLSYLNGDIEGPKSRRAPLHFADGGPVGGVIGGAMDFIAPSIELGNIGFAFEKGGSVPGAATPQMMQVDLRSNGSRATVQATDDQSKNLLSLLGELKSRSM